ncbi:MAG: cobalamin-dependent protein [Pseudomonadota bacterium]
MTGSHNQDDAITPDPERLEVVSALLAHIEFTVLQKALLPKLATGTLGVQSSDFSLAQDNELGLRRRRETKTMKPKKAPVLVEDDVTNLVALILDGSFEAVCAQVDEYIAFGHQVGDLILSLFSPAAVVLGQRWDDDDLSFSEVTLGMATLHSVLHRFSDRLNNEIKPKIAGGTMMIAPYPGENHLFGAAIVEEFMRADGWDVGIVMAESGASLVRKVRERHYDIVGLSLAHESQLSAMRQLIVSIRASSLNKRLAIVIGGPLVQSNPKLVETLPVEGIALDARQALSLTRDLFKRMPRDETELPGETNE